MASFGRRKIRIAEMRVDETNVLDVLRRTLPAHISNSNEIEHLQKVYRGDQRILGRKKTVREEINNKIIVNHANEIVSFKVAYLLSEPIAYVSRGANTATEKVNALNEMMFLNNKAARDKEVADDFSICGQAYRMALPNPTDGIDEAPFSIYTLDPRYTYVVYNNGLGEKPVCAVKYVAETNVTGESGEIVYSVYTEDAYFEIKNNRIIKHEPHALGMVPIIEYVNNNARIGVFEVVETLLDAINTLASNRVDATEQAVQALTVFYNCDISSDDYDELKRKGALKIKSVEGAESKVEMLTADFNQADQQVLMDALYEEVLRITGMPSQSNANTSDSSNNGAVIVRNGWYNAESRAKDTELLWRESEGNFLKLVFNICRQTTDFDMRLSDVTLKFTRRNYEDIQTRSQVLTTMLANPKIAPRLAFAHCGMFVDAEEAYAESIKWYEEHPEETEKTQPVTGTETVEPGE